MTDHYNKPSAKDRGILVTDSEEKEKRVDSRDLLKLRNWDLAHRAGTATHQHYKGGLYELLGVAVDSSDLDNQKYAYYHRYPHENTLWLRDKEDFESTVETPDWHPEFGKKQQIKRFRKLGEGW